MWRLGDWYLSTLGMRSESGAALSPPNLSLPWLQMRLVKEPPKYSYLAQANENPNLPETAVKPVNTWRFPLWLSSGRMPLSRMSLSRSFLTESTRVSYRRGPAEAQSKTGGKYAFGKGNFMVLGWSQLTQASWEWRGSAGVREAQNKLTSYGVIIIPAGGIISMYTSLPIGIWVGPFNLQDLSQSREGHRIPQG